MRECCLVRNGCILKDGEPRMSRSQSRAHCGPHGAVTRAVHESSADSSSSRRRNSRGGALWGRRTCFRRGLLQEDTAVNAWVQSSRLVSGRRGRRHQGWNALSCTACAACRRSRDYALGNNLQIMCFASPSGGRVLLHFLKRRLPFFSARTSATICRHRVRRTDGTRLVPINQFISMLFGS